MAVLRLCKLGNALAHIAHLAVNAEARMQPVWNPQVRQLPQPGERQQRCLVAIERPAGVEVPQPWQLSEHASSRGCISHALHA
jgi:hypothetical protein